MGLNKDKGPKQTQLSLFDYKLPKADFSETPTTPKSKSVDFHDWAWAHREPEVNKAPRFLSFSAFVHGLALVAATFLIIPSSQDELKNEPIVIEIEDLGTSSLGIETLATQGGSVADSAPSSDLLDSLVDEAITKTAAPPMTSAAEATVAAPPAPAAPVPATAAAPVAKLPAKVAPSKSAAPLLTANSSPVVTPVVSAPTDSAKNDSALAEASTPADLSDELDSDFTKQDLAQADALEAEKASMAAMAEETKAQQLKKLAALDAAQKAEQQRVAEERKAAKAQKEAAALAAAEKEETRQREAAEAAESAAMMAQQQRLQEENAQNKANLAAAALASDTGQGEMEGAGQGNQGLIEPATDLAGSASGIRSLDQLEQMPGNPKPQYDRIERRRGDQGQVAFAAYISKAGQPTQFKMLKSTGHRNLDGKTLAALKKWRFKPGQEGWVELPFRWDLKGGVQEDGGLLRRSAQGF